MLNVYVSLVLRGVTTAVLDDEAWSDAFWSVLPDASLSAEAGGVGITLSQWALTKREAIRGQSGRVRAALSALGVHDVDVVLEPLSERATTLFVDRTERLPRPASGAGWFDYRFPAPPECFIGRHDSLKEVASAVEQIRAGATAIRAIQVLSGCRQELTPHQTARGRRACDSHNRRWPQPSVAFRRPSHR